jgi:hypothetical protein
MVFQAYVDNSYDRHVHVLAGYIATADKWPDFSDEWQATLDGASLNAFKMTHVARQENCNLMCQTFYRVIEKYAQESFSIVVDIDALTKIVSSITWPLGVFDGENWRIRIIFRFTR